MQRVFVVFVDNGKEPYTGMYDKQIMAVYDSEERAELALALTGFSERDSTGYFWHKTRCAWIEPFDVISC